MSGKPQMRDADEYNLQYYVVCVIDVLGQWEKLAQWSEMPLDGVLSPELIGALKNTVGTVLGFKEVFEKYFSQVSQCIISDKVALLPPKEQLLFQRYRDCVLKTQRFSDTFVFYAPLQNSFGDLSVVQVHQILGACSSAMLTSLAARIPVRGGVTIGTGIEIEDLNLYGPALAVAHFLESRIAEYPRVIVSPEVLRFLDMMEGNADAGELERIMSGMAKECRKLVTIDADRRWIVDYMGPGVLENLPVDDTFQKAIGIAYGFACSEAERFRVEGNSKLALRYASLQRYIESRMKLWIPYLDGVSK